MYHFNDNFNNFEEAEKKVILKCEYFVLVSYASCFCMCNLHNVYNGVTNVYNVLAYYYR